MYAMEDIFGVDNCKQATSMGKVTTRSYLGQSIQEAKCFQELVTTELVQMPCIGKFNHPDKNSDYF